LELLISEAGRLIQTQPGALQWFSWETLCTGAGSTAAVIAVTSVLQKVSAKFPAKWFALGLSLVLSLVCISVRCQKWTVPNIFLALLNGIMTYSASVGINTIVTTSAATLTPNVARRTYRWWP
jgi:hypothetical protein